MSTLCGAILAAAIALPSAATALSCKPPNFAEDFNRVSAADEVYSLVFGRFAESSEDLADATNTELRFTGKRLGVNGFRVEETFPVAVSRECVGDFCAPFPKTGTHFLAYFQHIGQGFAYVARPCAADLDLNPSIGRVSALRTCMRLGECGPDEISAFNPDR